MKKTLLTLIVGFAFATPAMASASVTFKQSTITVAVNSGNTIKSGNNIKSGNTIASGNTALYQSVTNNNVAAFGAGINNVASKGNGNLNTSSNVNVTVN